ncbi:MAG TPA: flagellar protein FlgN [Nitrospiraceae bacterium]|nr:flagellar protein FlgN [Nitrospiraceae bacterium]
MSQADMSGYDLLVHLLEILKALQQRTQSFADLLIQERQAIKMLAMDQLTSLNEVKLRLIDELTRYEDVRKGIIEQLAALWKAPADSMTIGWIAGHIGEPVAGQLKRQQAQLNQSILAAKRSNQVTGTVLHKSLAFLHAAVSIARSPFQTQPALYSESGSVLATTREGGLLERRG